MAGSRLLAVLGALALAVAATAAPLAAGHRCVAGCGHCEVPAPSGCGCCHDEAPASNPALAPACGCEWRPAPVAPPGVTAATAAAGHDLAAAPLAAALFTDLDRPRAGFDAQRPDARAPPPAARATTVLRL